MIWMAFLDGVNFKKKKKGSSLYLALFPNFKTKNKANRGENGNVKSQNQSLPEQFYFSFGYQSLVYWL